MNPTPTIDLLTFAMAAKRLRVSLREFQREVAAGKIAYVEIGPRTNRILRTDFDAYIVARRKQHGVKNPNELVSAS